jgi:hypothetical protein
LRLRLWSEHLGICKHDADYPLLVDPIWNETWKLFQFISEFNQKWYDQTFSEKIENAKRDADQPKGHIVPYLSKDLVANDDVEPTSLSAITYVFV